MNVLLIAGGWSSEREVSLRGASGIELALKERGHKVTLFDLSAGFDSLLDIAAKYDFAFMNLHGSPGEDGLVQAMLDSINCPYQGSRPAGSMLALHKAAAKQIFRRAGLLTPNFVYLPIKPVAGWKPNLPYPIFVKGNTGGSSLNLSFAKNEKEFFAAVEAIFAANDEVIAETAITGMEVTCGILGSTPLPPVLIKPLAGAFFDHQSKYVQGGATEICPAPLPEHIIAKVQNMALTAHKALGLEGYSRADFILDDKENIYILEVNTLPGMTTTSLLPQEAAAIGLSFGELLEKLIEYGVKK